jgi:site-specific recombinase XerD
MNQSTRVHITDGYVMADNKQLNDNRTPDKKKPRRLNILREKLSVNTSNYLEANMKKLDLGKSGQNYSTVFEEQARPYLKAWLAARNRALLDAGIDSEWLFVTKRGTQMTERVPRGGQDRTQLFNTAFIGKHYKST